MIFGVVGLLLISCAIWFRNQKWQDLLFVIGGLFLLAYSIRIGDRIFIILQCVFILSAVIELMRLIRRKRRAR